MVPTPDGVEVDKGITKGDTCAIHSSHDASSSGSAGGSGTGESADKDIPQSNIKTYKVGPEVDIYKDSSISSCHDQSPCAVGTFTVSDDLNSLVPSVSCSSQETKLVPEDGSVYPVAATLLESVREMPNKEVLNEDETTLKCTLSSPLLSPVIIKPSEEFQQEDDSDRPDAMSICEPVLSSCTASYSTENNTKAVEEPELHGEEVFYEKLECESLHGTSNSKNSNEQSDDETNKEIKISSLQDWKEINSVGSRHLAEQTKDNDIKMDTSSNIHFEFGDDALEFAVLVAIEAQHEVADREQSRLSPKGRSDSKKTDSGTCISGGKNVEKESESHLGDKTSPNKSISDKHIDSVVSRDSEQTMEFTPTSVGQEPIMPFGKRKCNFDLNEVSYEDAEDMSVTYFSTPNNVFTPIAVVALSKELPILPFHPLLFEGELGWKGSSATSAFRPAPPRRNADGETTPALSKQKPVILDIDLNLVEEEDVIKNNAILNEIVASFSSMLFRQSLSVEFTSGKEKKLKLDLNEIGDEDCSFSPSLGQRLSLSSASVCKQTDDLNDKSLSFNASTPAPYQHSNDYGNHKRLKLEDKVITLMGIELKESNRNNIHPALSHISSTGSLAPPRAHGFSPRVNLPAHGHGGLALPPNQYHVTPSYRPGYIPYMVDSRRATLPPDLNGPSASTMPFPGNVASASPPGSFSFGSVASILDLNAGISPTGGGSRGFGSIERLCLPGELDILSQEQTETSYLSPFSSGMAVKRKEQDQNWDFGPVGTVGYKHLI